jgi:hypothetical protein
LINAAARKLKAEARFGRKLREARRAFYREMLACHRAALDLLIRCRLQDPTQRGRVRSRPR